MPTGILAPDAIISSTNLSGAVTAIDEPVEWLPVHFPGVTGWWSMQRSPNLPAVNNDLTQWDDMGGSSRHWGQASALSYPVHVLRNSLPAASFVRANSDAMDIGDTLATMIGATGLCAVVCEMNGNPSNPTGDWFSNDAIVADASGFWGIAARYHLNTTPSWIFGLYDTVKKEIPPITATAGQSAVLLMYRTSGSVLTASVDGGTEQTLSSVGAPGTQTGVLRLGVNWQAAAFFNGWIREVVTSTSNGDATDRQNLVDYLKSEWGIS